MADDVHADTTSRDFFEAVYDAADDPWSFGTDPYELDRYRHIVSLLGDRSFGSGFEPGCSIGVLTALLAPHCERLFATDLSARAVERALERCRRLPNVQIQQGRFPDVLPTAPVDLVVLSEIGYYFTPAALTDAVERVMAVASPDALVVAAHWTGESADHLMAGDDVHDTLARTPALDCIADDRRPGYVVGCYRPRVTSS